MRTRARAAIAASAGSDGSRKSSSESLMSTTTAGVVRVVRLEGADLARLSYRVDSESGGGRECAGAGEGPRRSTGERGVWLRLYLR